MKLDGENIRDTNPVGLRLPAELKEKIKNAAKENKQSINAEIVRRLEGSFIQKTNGTLKDEIIELLDAIDDNGARLIEGILRTMSRNK